QDAEEDHRDGGEHGEPDGSLPAAPQDGGFRGRLDGGCGSGAHAPHPFDVSSAGPMSRTLTRNTARTSGGAAMNSTINDWITRKMSMGVPVPACIVTPPARSAPNSRPAATVPHGLVRPSSATVMASKPRPAEIPVVR